MSSATIEPSSVAAGWPPDDLTRRVVAWCEPRADRIQAVFYAGVGDIPDALVLVGKATHYDFDLSREFHELTIQLRREDGFRFYPFMTGYLPEEERAWSFRKYDPAKIIFGS